MNAMEAKVKQKSTSDAIANALFPGESTRSFLGLKKWNTQNERS